MPRRKQGRENLEVKVWEYEQRHPTKEMRKEAEVQRNIKKWEKQNGRKMDSHAWDATGTPLSKKSAKKVSPVAGAKSVKKKTTLRKKAPAKR